MDGHECEVGDRVGGWEGAGPIKPGPSEDTVTTLGLPDFRHSRPGSSRWSGLPSGASTQGGHRDTRVTVYRTIKIRTLLDPTSVVFLTLLPKGVSSRLKNTYKSGPWSFVRTRKSPSSTGDGKKRGSSGCPLLRTR